MRKKGPFNLRQVEGAERLAKAAPTVRADGHSLQTLIDGVIVRYTITHVDARGSLTEIFNPEWTGEATPVVFSYWTTIRPRVVKGWNVHLEQDDRIFTARGSQKWVLYDGREGSPTYRMLNELCFSDERRAFVYVPRGVYHAVQNIGLDDAVYVGFPSEPYRYDDPDKYCLPPDNDVIPYRFQGPPQP